MLLSKVPVLAVLLENYYEPGELHEVAQLFGIELPNLYSSSRKQEWLALAHHLVKSLEQGNHRLLLQALIEQLEVKNVTAIGNTDWECRTAHERLRLKIAELQTEFDQGSVPAEIAIPEGTPFTAKSKIRELLATASPPILVVDPYIGIATLDCLRSVPTTARLLTGNLSA